MIDFKKRLISSVSLGDWHLMRDRGFRRRMQFNIKRRMYEHVLTASSVCIDTSFLFSSLALRLYKTVVLFYQWQHKPNCNNVVKNSKKKTKKRKKKNRSGINFTCTLDTILHHRVGQGFWVYGIQGLFRVYSILQLKCGYSVYHFLWISGIKYTWV